jgi:hypothetical protein
MSLITGNKVKKKPHKPRYCEKEKDKANKRILRSLSFDKSSCNNVAPVNQKMYFRDCKTLSAFERKIPLTLEFRFHQE